MNYEDFFKAFGEAIGTIIAHYGKNKQLIKAVEEFSELIVAIQKYTLDPCEKTRKAVTEEIADSIIMLPQIIYLLGIQESEVSDMIPFKLNRALERIKNESNNTDGI